MDSFWDHLVQRAPGDFYIKNSFSNNMAEAWLGEELG